MVQEKYTSKYFQWFIQKFSFIYKLYSSCDENKKKRNADVNQVFIR